MLIMTNIKNRLGLYVEKTEKLAGYLVKRRHDSIQKSLIRPLYQEALKCFFYVFILLIDTLIPLQIFIDFPDIINIVLALFVLIVFLYLEMRVYNLIWGKKGRWSLDKYKKIYEEIKNN